MERYAIGLDVGITSVGWSVVELKNDKPCQIIGMGSRIFDAAEHPKTGASLALPRREARSMRRRIRRFKHRKERIRDLLVKSDVVTEEELSHLYDKIDEDIYALRVRALDEIVTGSELARILIHISQRRGFKSNRKNAAADEDGKLLAAVSDNKKRMEENQYRTVAEMLLLDPAYAASKRNKGGEYISTVSRDMVEAEVHAIFAAQRALGNPLATKVLEEDYLTILLSQRSFDDGPGKGSPYAGNIIERMIGKCSFEPDEKRAAKASFSFEYFALLEAVNHIQIIYNKVSTPLDADQRKAVIALALQKPDINYTHIRKALALTEEATFNMVYYKDNDKKASETKTKFPYMRSYHKMRKAFNIISKNYFDNIPVEKRNALAEALIRYKTSERLRPVLREAGFTEEEIDAAETLSFSGTGHLSAKACDKIIPYLEQGMRYNDACEAAGYAFRGHDGTDKAMYLPPIGEDEKNEITSPVVLRSVSQTIKVVNAIIREIGCSPTYINLELAREMSKNFNERNKIRKDQEANRALNERLMDKLRNEFHIVSPTAQDLVKLKLYEEQDGICAYSLKPIPIELLTDDNVVQVDHIVPYSISFDDTYKNKVLVFAKENQDKGNRLPLQYLQDERRDNFIVWVSNNVKNPVKKNNLLKEAITDADRNKFKERNLQDTKHATAFLLNYISDHLLFADFESGRKKHVTAVNGMVTSYLRKRWGISKIRANGDLHHAVDALVVACATDGMIQSVSNYMKYRETRYTPRYTRDLMEGCKVDPVTGEILKVYFPEPWDTFIKDLNIRMSEDPARAIVDQEGDTSVDYGRFLRPLFVSRMANHKVTGAAHMETVMSKKELDTGVVVKKVPLTSLKLVDGEIPGYYKPHSDWLLYNALVARLKEFGGDAKKAFEEPFHKPKSDGTPGPLVTKVKLYEKANITVPVYNGEGVAVNDSIVRIDVFYVPGEGYYYVPIYVADTVRKDLPNKACIAFKPMAEWKIMDDKYFIFSLYKNDLVRVVHKKGIELKKQNIESDLPDIKPVNDSFMYFTGANVGTAAISCITHDNSYIIKALGVKTLIGISKYTVDVLGNITPIHKEKRMPFTHRNK